MRVNSGWQGSDNRRSDTETTEMCEESDGCWCNHRTEIQSSEPQSLPVKSPAHATFDGTDESKAGAVVIHLSNSETVGLAHIEAARRKTELAFGTSFAALEAHAEAGQELIEAKKQLGHGNFDREVSARLGISKQWRARIMKVGEFWSKILQALEWAKATGRLTKTEYSVDGALRLLKQWQREVEQGGNSGGGRANCFWFRWKRNI